MQSMWFSGNKVKVFISSKCGGRYAPVRSALKLLLEESGIADVYVYELAPGSTQDNKSAYLDEVKKSEVCVFLVHNADAVVDGGIRPAVFDEYRCARDWKKRCVFAFCDEANEGDSQIPPTTEIQKEIERTQGEKYILIKTFSDFTINVYKTVVNDIIDVYHAYCMGSLARQEGKAETPLRIGASEQRTAADSFLGDEIRVTQQLEQQYNDSPKKRFTQGFRKTEKCVSNFMVAIEKNWPEDIVAQLDNQPDTHLALDELCTQFFLALIGKQAIPKGFFTQLGLEVDLFLGKDTLMTTIVQLRLKGIAAYWGNHLPTCLKYLKKAYAVAQKADRIPAWFINDIIIDLRHVLNIQESIEGKSTWSNQWDKTLDKQESALQYPLLDRVESSLYEQAFKILMDSKTTSPYTTKLGIGYEAFASQAAHAHVLAILHGSLVQILHTRNRLADGLAAFCSVYYVPEMFKSQIICNLLIQDEKALEKQMQFYHGFSGADALDASDAAELLSAVALIPVSFLRNKANLVLIHHFGFQFSDTDFTVIEKSVKLHIQNWMTQDRRACHLETSPLISALTYSAWRFDSDFIADFLVYIIQNVPFALYHKLVDLVRSLDYTRLSDAKLVSLAASLAAACANAEIQRDSHSSRLLTDVLLTLRMRTDNLYVHQLLDEAVRQHDLKIYNMQYGLNILAPDQKAEAVAYIHEFVKDINERTQKSKETRMAYGNTFQTSINGSISH